MEKAKLLAALMLVGFCGISQAEARPQRREIKHLERQRAQLQAECRESRERLKELGRGIGMGSRNWLEEDELEEAESDFEDGIWQPRQNPNLEYPGIKKERDVESARMKAAALEMEKIDRAIRKEEAQERCGRERKQSQEGAPLFTSSLWKY